MQLELALAVDEIDERRPALIAPRDHPAGYAVGAVALLARLQIIDDVGCRDHARELMRVGIDALLAQACQLGSAVVNRRGIVHAAGGYSSAARGCASARSW